VQIQQGAAAREVTDTCLIRLALISAFPASPPPVRGTGLSLPSNYFELSHLVEGRRGKFVQDGYVPSTMADMTKEDRSREFARLWTAHGQRVYAYILTLLSNRADADEVFQDTAMTLWEKFERFDLTSNFRLWARGVAFNKVRNFRQLRRHNVRVLSNESLELVSQTTMVQATELDRQHEFLSDCYAELTSADRELIDLRYRPGATMKTVALEVGRSVDAIYKALARIHWMLFECVRNAVNREKRS
jgi:RNA polymerase sigma-70 factor, ECF subfamily